MIKPYTAYDHVDVTYASDTKADARTIGKVDVQVDAVITDERYRECMGLLREANERIEELEAENEELRELVWGMWTRLTGWPRTWD